MSARATRLRAVRPEGEAETYWVWANREKWLAEHPQPQSPGPRRMERPTARRLGGDTAGEMLAELAPEWTP